MQSSRDAETLGRIAWWNAVAPSYRWNQIAMEEALRAGMPVNLASRHLAVLHTALADAMVAAWDSKAGPRPPPARLGRPGAAARRRDARKSVLPGRAGRRGRRCGHGAVRESFPVALPSSHGWRRSRGGCGWWRASRIRATSRPAPRSADRSRRRRWSGPGATHRPALDRIGADGAGRVDRDQPRPGPGAGMGAVAPVLGGEFRPPPPAGRRFGGARDGDGELRAVERTPFTNARAVFWEAAAGGLRSHEYWNNHAGRLLLEYGQGADAPRAARTYALLNVALYDGGVACWDAKYAYWTIRPMQLDREFRPVIPVPNHPSYPSAHTCFSTAAAAVLAHLFPRDGEAMAALAREAGESESGRASTTLATWPQPICSDAAWRNARSSAREPTARAPPLGEGPRRRSPWCGGPSHCRP